MWTLHKGEHAAAIDLKAVPGIGAEVVLTVNGEMRKTRLFRPHERAELVSAIADTRTMLRGEGVGVNMDEDRTRVNAALPPGRLARIGLTRNGAVYMPSRAVPA